MPGSDQPVTLSVGRPSTRAIARRRHFLDGGGTARSSARGPVGASFIHIEAYYAGGGDKINGVIITKNNGRDAASDVTKHACVQSKLAAPPLQLRLLLLVEKRIKSRQDRRRSDRQRHPHSIIITGLLVNPRTQAPNESDSLAEMTDSVRGGDVNARKISADARRDVTDGYWRRQPRCQRLVCGNVMNRKPLNAHNVVKYIYHTRTAKVVLFLPARRYA